VSINKYINNQSAQRAVLTAIVRLRTEQFRPYIYMGQTLPTCGTYGLWHTLCRMSEGLYFGIAIEII